MKIKDWYLNIVLAINLFINLFVSKRFKLENEDNFDHLILKIVKLSNDPKIEDYSILDHFNKKTLIYSIIKDIFDLRYLYFFKRKDFKIRSLELLEANKNIEDILNFVIDLIYTQKLLSQQDVLNRIVTFIKLKFNNMDIETYIENLNKNYKKEALELEDLKVNEQILESLYYSVHFYKILTVNLPTEKIILGGENKIISVVEWLEGTINLPEPKNLTLRSVFNKEIKNFNCTGFIPFKRKSR